MKRNNLDTEFENLVGQLYTAFGEVSSGEKTNEAFEKFKKEILEAIKEAMFQMTMSIASKISKGDKGDKGDSPTKEEIIEVMNPLIPIKGKDYFTQDEISSFKNSIKPIKGKDYFDGYIPVKNKDYFDGNDGVTPIAGVDYPSHEQLGQHIKNEVTKLFSAQNSEFIEEIKKGFSGIIDEIKSLKNTDENILKRLTALEGQPYEPRSRRRLGGGGGMGNPNHQSFSVGPSTTTFTTTYPIAAGGAAIWAYYNGQLIVRGTHYTVGSDNRTGTLLFTPQDSTTIDVIYIQ